MRAVVYEGFGRAAEVREVPDPSPSAEGVVIRVEATGLCRSDWHGWMGHDPDIRIFPHVPGHELAGTIEAVGPLVRDWRPGDRVTVPFICACGRCHSCATGNQQVCERQTQPGFTHWGSFAEYTAIDHADVNLIGLPERMGAASAASLGCRFATAFRAVVDQGGVAPGEWVAVHGCGGVGLSAVMIAAASGAKVVAVDVSPGALKLAADLGATVLINATESDAPQNRPSQGSPWHSGPSQHGPSQSSPSQHGPSQHGPSQHGPSQSSTTQRDPAERVREATGGGAHLSLDALGSPATCSASINGLRRGGRHVQVGLLPAANGQTPLPMDRVIAFELRILGSHGMAAHAYGPMMEMIGAGLLNPDRLITRTIGLGDVPDALSAMGASPGITMIKP